MSNPKIAANDMLSGAVSELASALTSLNMKPELLSEPLNDLGYLSSVDMWVVHAVEHINAAIKMLRLVVGNQLLEVVDNNSEYTVLLREMGLRHIITSRLIFLINNWGLSRRDEILNEMVHNPSRYLLDESSLFEDFERTIMKPSMINRYTRREDDVSGYPEHEFMVVRIFTTKNHYYPNEPDPDNGEIWKPMYLYFDIDCPEGVSNWMDLPVFKRHRGEEVDKEQAMKYCFVVERSKVYHKYSEYMEGARCGASATTTNMVTSIHKPLNRRLCKSCLYWERFED